MMTFELRWTHHVLAAFAPHERVPNLLSPTEGEVDYIGTFTHMMHEATPLAALGMRIAVWMAASAPLWHCRVFAMIGGLADERRTQLLRELLTHRVRAVRELSLLLKLCASMALLGTPSVRARSGYDNVHDIRIRLPVVTDGAKHQ